MIYFCRHGSDSYVYALWSVKPGPCRRCGAELQVVTDRDKLLHKRDMAQFRLDQANAAVAQDAARATTDAKEETP